MAGSPLVVQFPIQNMVIGQVLMLGLLIRLMRRRVCMSHTHTLYVILYAGHTLSPFGETKISGFDMLSTKHPYLLNLYMFGSTFRPQFPSVGSPVTISDKIMTRWPDRSPLERGRVY